MKTIYIDHNILIYLHKDTGHIYKSVIDKIIGDNDFTFVFSIWNLVEIVTGNEIDAAIELASLVDSLNPMWLVERLNIQEEEVKEFLANNYYHHDNSDIFNPIKKHLSEVFYYLDPRTVRINDNAVKAVTEWAKYPDSMAAITGVKQSTPDALTAIQTARKNKTITQSQLQQIDKIYYGNLLPSYAPDNKPIHNNERVIMRDFLVNNKRELLRASPCLNVEEKISDFRTRNVKRIPEEQDAIDLQHLASSLAYCNYLISNDGFFISGAEFVKKHCNLTDLTIYRDLLDLSI